MNSAYCYDLVNDKGRAFTAVYEPAGGAREEAVVSFYDATYDYIPYPGQAASSYYVETLMQHRGCLRLHGAVPEWMLSEFNVLDTKAWLLTLEPTENSA